MNPMENLFNYITGDNILFSVVQGYSFYLPFWHFIETLKLENKNY
jgi:hypothetical protein